MSFESDTLALLVGSVAVTALVPAAAISFGTAPQNADQPFIVCIRVSTTPTPSLDNGNSLAARADNVSLQITGYAQTYVAANTLAGAIRGALEANRPSRYILRDQRGDYDDATDLKAQILSFSCWHIGASPV